jgi:hypothetical protein
MAISAVTGVLFTILAVAVAIHPAPFFFDRPIAVDVQSVNAGAIPPLNTFVSAFEGFVGVGVGVAVIAITFVLRRPATLFVAFSALYVAIYTGINIVIARPRPTGLVHTTPHLTGYGFPSGHVAFLVWLGVVALVLLARGLPRILLIGCWILVAAVAVGAALRSSRSKGAASSQSAVANSNRLVPGEGVEPSRSCLRRFLRPQDLGPRPRPTPISSSFPCRRVPQRAAVDRHSGCQRGCQPSFTPWRVTARPGWLLAVSFLRRGSAPPLPSGR